MSDKKKVLILGIDGFDPHLVNKYIKQGLMPNTVEFLKRGSANVGLEMIGGHPTVTPPMWTTLATGATAHVHGITGYYRHDEYHRDVLKYNFDSTNCHAEQLWNVTAEAGYKTLVWHWPGSSWPPSSDSKNLYVIDGTQPGGINVGTGQVDGEFLVAGSVAVQSPSFRARAAADASVPCFITGMEEEKDAEDEMNLMANRLTVKETQRVCTEPDEIMQNLAYTPFDMVSTPISPAKGWTIDIPEDAFECTILLSKGYIRRPALILKGENDEYDRVVIYKNKKALEPIATLPKDVYVKDIVDEAMRGEERVACNRNARLLDIEPDGSKLRIWISAAMDFNDDTCWSPKSLRKVVVDNVGYPQPVSLAGGVDPLLVEKCMRATWDAAAEWNAKGIKFMAREQGFDVIFSHFHNVDLQGHALIAYLKNGSEMSAEKCQELWAQVYVQTDNYIGEFLPLLDEGWDILIVSDHGQTTPEHDPQYWQLDTGGVCAVAMKNLGYTVLKKDENGNELKEIDWSKTVAHTASYCHIFLNVKGRDPKGIVDPEDKWDLEEKIITDLYSLRSPETGRRIVSMALHNKDAVLMGEGGPDSGDIVFYIAEGYTADHADSFSTADGACDTSVRSVFMAAGPGIKEDYRTERIVRHMDVTPTVASLLGIRMPNQCEGAPVYQILE